MSAPPKAPQQCGNLLLSLLPDEDYRALLPHLEMVPTPLHMVLYERAKPLRHAYFPCSGEHSILAIMENGATVEVGTVGYEGFSTVDLLTGNDVATETTLCQIAGESLRMPASVLLEKIREDGPLRRILLRYLQAYLSQVSQSVACNRLHGLEQRFARWILMSHDRVRRTDFMLTQEYLAGMLGVHRPSVSRVAKEFQRDGVLEYNRGVVSVLDRVRLEQRSCECYIAVRAQFERLLGVTLG